MTQPFLPTPDPGGPSPAAPERRASLTQRAGLTFRSNLLQQVARLLVSLVATPIIVRGLGAELYGAWTMIQQATGYLSLGDARPMGALKFILATEQHLEDADTKRRQVGAALVLWLAGLPLLLTVGYGLVRLAPALIRVGPESVGPVQLALALSVIALAMDRLLGLPVNVLRGVNLDYRATWLNTGALVLGGVATCWAILRGYGLVGLAAVSILVLLITCLPRFWIVLREVAWFGVRRPRRVDLARFTRLGGWLFLIALASLLLTASDLLVVGYMLGPKAAAVYAMTGAALRFCVEPIALLLSAGNAGLAGLCATRQFDRVQQVRGEMLSAGVVLFVAVGAGVLLLNRSFLGVWVGSGLYAGDATNGLLVVLGLQLLFVRTEGVIIDGVMAFRERAITTLAAGALGLLLGALLARWWGLPGMALGTVLARGLLVWWMLRITHRHTGIPVRALHAAVLRPLLVATAILGSAALVPVPELHGWLTLLPGAGAVGGISLLVMIVVGLDSRQRQTLLFRARAAIRSGREWW